MTAELLDRVLQIAADTFDEPLEKLSADSSPDTVENWDSLTHLNFVLALEQSFACEVEPEEAERAAKSIKEAVLMLERKKARG